MHIAVEFHHPLIDLLLEYNADVCCYSENEFTPVFMAARTGYVACLKLLLEKAKQQGQFNLSKVARKLVFGVWTRSDTNSAVQPQKYYPYTVHRLFYPFSEHKGADLCLSFNICKMKVFS